MDRRRGRSGRCRARRACAQCAESAGASARERNSHRHWCFCIRICGRYQYRSIDRPFCCLARVAPSSRRGRPSSVEPCRRRRPANASGAGRGAGCAGGRAAGERRIVAAQPRTALLGGSRLRAGERAHHAGANLRSTIRRRSHHATVFQPGTRCCARGAGRKLGRVHQPASTERRLPVIRDLSRIRSDAGIPT